MSACPLLRLFVISLLAACRAPAGVLQKHAEFVLRHRRGPRAGSGQTLLHGAPTLLGLISAPRWNNVSDMVLPVPQHPSPEHRVCQSNIQPVVLWHCSISKMSNHSPQRRDQLPATKRGKCQSEEKRSAPVRSSIDLSRNQTIVPNKH